MPTQSIFRRGAYCRRLNGEERRQHCLDSKFRRPTTRQNRVGSWPEAPRQPRNERMKKILAIPVVSAAFAVLVGLTWIGARATHQARSALAALAQRRAALTLGIERTANEIAAEDHEQVRLRAALEDSRVSAASASSAEARLNSASILAANPKLFALYLNYYRAFVGQEFGTLYKRLGLTTEQIGKFEELMADHQDAAITLKAVALSQGLKESNPAIETLQQQEDDTLHAAVVALLGESGFAQFHQAARLAPVWPLVNDLATRVGLTSTPLSESQASELVQIIANADAGYRNGGAADPDETKIDWDEAMPQAQAILSEPQLSVLRMRSEFSRVTQLEDQFYRRQSAEK